MFTEIIYKSEVYDHSTNLNNLFFDIVPYKKTTHNEQLFSCVEQNLKYMRGGYTSKERFYFWSLLAWYITRVFGANYVDYNKERLSNILLADLLGLHMAWRHIKGYPVRGQRTHSNGNSSSSTNKALLNFRVGQYNAVFGSKKKTNYPVLIVAEYLNKLWKNTWLAEWVQARLFSYRNANFKQKNIPIDITTASKNFSTGYPRTGNAARMNKEKKLPKTITVGLPVYYTKFIFSDLKANRFGFKLVILNESSKKKQK